MPCRCSSMSPGRGGAGWWRRTSPTVWEAQHTPLAVAEGVEQPTVGRGGGWLVAGDAPVVAQALHDRGGKAQAAGAAAALAVEDAGDGGIGVVGRQPADECDGGLVGADRWWVGAGQLDGQFAGLPAAPARQQPGAGGVAVDGDDDLLQQGPQQLLAVPVGGG